MIKIKHRTTQREIEVAVEHYENILKHQDWEICNVVRREDAQLQPKQPEGESAPEYQTDSEDRPKEGKSSDEQGQSVRKAPRLKGKTNGRKKTSR